MRRKPACPNVLDGRKTDKKAPGERIRSPGILERTPGMGTGICAGANG